MQRSESHANFPAKVGGSCLGVEPGEQARGPKVEDLEIGPWVPELARARSEGLDPDERSVSWQEEGLRLGP